MHGSAYTTTIVHVRLDAGEQFTYTGRTAIGGNEAKARIHTLLLTVRDDAKPGPVVIRGTGLNMKTGKPLRVDREFKVALEMLEPHIVRELFLQFKRSHTLHHLRQQDHQDAGAWKTDT